MQKKSLIMKGIILLCILCLFTGCNKENKDMVNQPVNSDLGAEKNNTESDEIHELTDKIITWTVPAQMNPEIIGTSVLRINEKLKEDGYNFTLQVKTFPSRTYREDIISLLESGEADIVSTGINMMNGSTGYSQDLIRAGYLEELSDYLSSEPGQLIWNWYHEDEWKRVETDGKYYVFPSQNNVYGSGYFAFNKDYVTEEMLKNFSGTSGELIELLSSIECPDGINEVLGTTFAMSSLYAISGVTYEQGVFYDLVTGEAQNPFSNQAFYQQVKDMNELYTKGSIKIFDGINALELENQAVRNGDFLIWIGYKKDAFYEEIKDSVYSVPIKQSMINALSSTSGINKNSPDKEAALQLLTLLYTDKTYANLLLFGEEGTDYQLIDGYVCDMAGNAMSNNSRSWIFGTLDLAYPCSNDLIVVDKNTTQDVFFESEYYLDSAILGFQPDCTGFSADMKKAMTILNGYSQIWKEEDLEAAWAKANAEFEATGGNGLVQELNRQVAEWMKKQNR